MLTVFIAKLHSSQQIIYDLLFFSKIIPKKWAHPHCHYKEINSATVNVHELLS